MLLIMYHLPINVFGSGWEILYYISHSPSNFVSNIFHLSDWMCRFMSCIWKFFSYYQSKAIRHLWNRNRCPLFILSAFAVSFVIAKFGLLTKMEGDFYNWLFISFLFYFSSYSGWETQFDFIKFCNMPYIFNIMLLQNLYLFHFISKGTL